MIKVTFEFLTLEEALAGLARMAHPLIADKQTRVADTPKPVAEKAAKPTPAPAAAPSGQEAPAASAASTDVDYKTLQAATFKLANRDREAAAAVVKTFRVSKFTELPANLWGAALGAVEAKLAELESVA